MKTIKLLFAALLLLSTLIFSGCGNDEALTPGTYEQILIAPNGHIIAHHKVSDEDAKKMFSTFKVEFGEDKKLHKITHQTFGVKSSGVWYSSDYMTSYHFTTLKYSEHENSFTLAYFDNAGNPTNPLGYTTKFKYDNEKDKSVTKAYKYDKNGEILGSMNFKYDSKNPELLSKITFFDKDGERSAFFDKIYSIVYKYDEKANINSSPTNISYQSKDGEPAVYLTKIANVENKFDKDGRLVERTTKGLDDSPVALSGAITLDKEDPFILSGSNTKFSYDKDSFMPNKVAFFDSNGEPYRVGDSNAVAITFDVGQNRLTLAALDSAGNPAPCVDCSQNVYKKVIDFKNGYATAVSFLGKDNKPTYDTYGVVAAASVRYEYNDSGEYTSYSYFGLKGEPINVLGYKGHIYHKIVATSDSTQYYDTNNHLITNYNALRIAYIDGLYGTWTLLRSDGRFKITITPSSITSVYTDTSNYTFSPSVVDTQVESIEVKDPNKWIANFYDRYGSLYLKFMYDNGKYYVITNSNGTEPLIK